MQHAGGQEGEPPLCTTRNRLPIRIFQSYIAVIAEHLRSFGLQQGFDPPSIAFPKSSCSCTFSFRSNIYVYTYIYYFPVTSHLTFPEDILLATEVTVEMSG